jgi:hypothetical protein
MTLHLDALSLDARDPEPVSRFWAEMLGRDVSVEDDAVLLPGDATQVGLRFVRSSSEKGAERVHLHLTSDTPAGQQETVDRALALGASHLDVGQLPEEEHVVLSDPGGNALCVIEAGNGFLAGCGPLGEVACDGTRATGVFWHHALGWPLVWDQDEETAIQAPAGGTKVAWGGPPVTPKHGRNRQRFDLVADDLDAEVARLTSLGATHVGDSADGVELADPDDNEFRVRVHR